MLNRLWTEEALEIAISGGADFAELFFEVSRSGGITLLDGVIDKI
jgi:predicted Zn-dependent protease